jgi:DNA-binding transcriptional ArsR family regulator
MSEVTSGAPRALALPPEVPAVPQDPRAPGAARPAGDFRSLLFLDLLLLIVVPADRGRRRIVEVLRGGEHSVGELAALVRMPQPGVSRQLRRLRDAGFVRVRYAGRRHLYSLREEALAELGLRMREYRQTVDRHFEEAEGLLAPPAGGPLPRN